MKNSKKILSLSLAATMLAGSTTAFAMPTDTIILGDKAFEILALGADDNVELQAQIDAAIKGVPDAESMFYKLGNEGGFLSLSDDTPMTTAQQDALKNVVLTKVDGTQEVYANFTDESGTVVEQADLTAYNAALNAVKEADYTAASWTEYQKVVTANPVTTSNTQAEVDAAKDKIVAAQKALVSVNGLAVESVKAVNLKTLEVKFNTAIDKDSVTASTMKVTNKTVALTVSDDNMMVTVAYAAGQEADQSEEVELEINGVKSLDETMKIENSKVKYTVVDTTIPVVTGIEVVNAKQFDILVSEPMNFSKTTYQVLNNIKINGTAVIAKATPNYAEGKIAIEFATAKAAGEYTVEIKDLADFAGYKAATVSSVATVLTDSSAPVIVNAVSKSLNEIEVTFDESVPVLNKGTFKVGNTLATATVVANSDNMKYKLTGFTLDLGSIVEVKITYKGQKDVAGNEVTSDTYYTFSVADDTALPTVSAEVQTGNKVVATFSKSMLTTAGTIKVLDKDSKIVKTIAVSGLTFKADSDNKVLELSGTTLGLNDVNPANYTLNFKDMKDSSIRANGLPTTDIVITALDTKSPTADSNYVVVNGTKTGVDLGKDDTITIYFSEAMDESTINNLSNYVIAGNSFAAIANVEVKSIADDAKSVVITYPKARDLTDSGSAITVYALKDVAGNMIVTNTSVTKLASSSQAIAIVGQAVAKVDNKVIVTYNTDIKSADPSVIKVQKSGVDYSVGIDAVVGIDGNNKIVTYTLDKAFDTTDTSTFTVVSNNHTLIKNVYDKTFTAAFGNQTVTDEILPVVKSVETYKVADVKQNNKVLVTFTEPVKVANVPEFALDIIVKDKDGKTIPGTTGYTYAAIDNTAVTTATDKVLLTFLPASGLVDGAQDITVQVAAERYIKDAEGNVIKASDVKTVEVVADAVLPTITKAETQDLDNNGKIDAYKITFSENIEDDNVTAGDFAIAGYTTPAFSKTTAGDVEDNNVIYITFAEGGAVDTGAKPELTYTAGDLTDLMGNKLANVANGDVTEIDMAAPVLMTFKFTDAAGSTANDVAWTVSEPLFTNAAGTTAVADTDDAVFQVDKTAVDGTGTLSDLAIDTVVSTTSFTGSADGNITDDAASSIAPKTATTLYDAAGNALPLTWKIETEQA